MKQKAEPSLVVAGSVAVRLSASADSRPGTQTQTSIKLSSRIRGAKGPHIPFQSFSNEKVVNTLHAVRPRYNAGGG